MLAYKLETNTLLLGTAAQQQQNNARIGDENALSATTPKIQNTTQFTTSLLQDTWELPYVLELESSSEELTRRSDDDLFTKA